MNDQYPDDDKTRVISRARADSSANDRDDSRAQMPQDDIWFMVEDGTDTRRILLREGQHVTVGRDQSQDLVIENQTLSRRHLILKRRGNIVEAEITGLNGLTLNDVSYKDQVIEIVAPATFSLGHVLCEIVKEVDEDATILVSAIPAPQRDISSQAWESPGRTPPPQDYSAQRPPPQDTPPQPSYKEAQDVSGPAPPEFPKQEPERSYDDKQQTGPEIYSAGDTAESADEYDAYEDVQDVSGPELKKPGSEDLYDDGQQPSPSFSSAEGIYEHDAYADFGPKEDKADDQYARKKEEPSPSPSLPLWKNRKFLLAGGGALLVLIICIFAVVFFFGEGTDSGAIKADSSKKAVKEKSEALLPEEIKVLPNDLAGKKYNAAVRKYRQGNMKGACDNLERVPSESRHYPRAKKLARMIKGCGY